MHLAAAFWHRLARAPDRILFERLDPSGAITWRQTRGELLDDAARWMAALCAAGVGPGDRVALSIGKSAGLVAAHLAVLGVGACVVPLNPALSAAETDAVLRQADVALAITNAALLTRAPETRRAVRGPWWVADGDAPSDTDPLSDVLADSRSGTEPRAGAADEDALLLFTSGTTGQPKGVGLTHANLAANLHALLVETWRMTEDDRLLHALPPHHLHGLALGLYGTLFTGGAAVLLERFDPAVVLAGLRTQRISIFMGVPTMYHRMVETEGDFALDSVRLCISGSAPLSVETFRRFEARFGHRIVERYGLTETGINTSNPIGGERRAGTVGTALPGIEVGVFDAADHRPLPHGQSGEIRVRGPNVFRGYWRNPAATAEAFHDGWFRTGDMGVLDADGYLTINGRMKELIIVGGTNVTPGEVEAALEPETGVREVAVAGVPNADLGETVAAFVVPRAGEDPAALEARLRQRAERDLASYKRPRLYRFLDEIPRNAMGKVERGKLVASGREAEGI